jgi:hypothetical protein
MVFRGNQITEGLAHASFRLATDVAAEMGVLEDDFSSCRICYNACSAAVKMLAVGGIMVADLCTF